MKALTWFLGITSILVSFETCAAVPGKGSVQISKIDNFKVDLHRALEGLRIRKKRQIEASYDTSSSNQMRVGSATAEDLSYLSDYKLTFWIPVGHRQVLVGTHEGNLILFQLYPDDDRQAHIIASSYEDEVSVKAKAFTYYDEQWFVILQLANNRTWIRLYQRVGRGLERQQSITLQGETDFDLVTLKGVHYMAVTTYQSSRNIASLALYQWMQTQFDLKATRTVYGPRSVACWVLDGTLFIAVAQKEDGFAAFSYGSPIFLYNENDEGGLVLQQMISIEGPTKVLHFYENRNHYIIFIGRQNAAIYWWSSNQFLLKQIIENTSNAADASVLTLKNGEVVIVIVLQEEILFITLDSSGHYIITFTMKFLGYNLQSFQFIYSGMAYYALALSAASSYGQLALPIWKITLDSYFVATGSSLDTMRQCLSDVNLSLDERQNEMNNIHVDLGRVWMRNKDQSIRPIVFVDGKTSSSQKCAVDDIVVIRRKQTLPTSSLSNIGESLSNLKEIVYELQRNVLKSVRKSVQQNISGVKYFHDKLHVPSLVLTSSNSNMPVNGVPIERMKEFALRKYGDQIFKKPIQADNVFTSNIFVDSINGIGMNDFLLLKGDQHVAGSLTFTNIKVNDITVDTINYIPVSNIVLTTGEQTIRGLKEISFMKSDTINVQGQTNGETLKEMLANIVQIIEDDSLQRRVIFNDILHIKGDIFLTGKTNGYINLAKLTEEAVHKGTSEELKGYLCFESPVTVTGDLLLNGKINNLLLSQLMTLSSDQIISGNLVFDTLLSVEHDLSTDYINDLNIKAKAVLKNSDPQFLTGHKTFFERVTADFIDMTEFVTLDNVDPSLLVQDLVKHKEGMVHQNLTVLPNVVVLNNLTVIEGINGQDIFDLPGKVWLRKTNQTVVAPVYWKKITATHVFITIVNTLNIDSDIVHSYGDETIISVKHFANIVEATSVEALDDVTVNGLNTVSLRTELERYVNDGTVHGKKTFGDMELMGDLDALTFNDFNVLGDILRPEDLQVVPTPVQFLNELTAIKGDLNSDVVWFDKFNNADLRSALEDVASKSTPKHPLQNKRFTDLKAQNLDIPPEDLINGQPISDLLDGVVTLNTVQQVKGEKSFKSELYVKDLTVETVNGIVLSGLISEIVYVDDNVPVSSKIFIGAFSLPSITVHQPINEVDLVQLSQNSFNKSGINELIHPVRFINGIEIGKLVTGYKIDDVDWHDLILTKSQESLESLKLISDTNVWSNIFLTGSVNGCDLQQIQKNALYSNKSTQVIQEEITIENIEVIGNVYFDILNEVPLQNLMKKLVPVAGDKIISTDVILESGVQTANLNMADMIADFNLPLILKDAVKRSVPQTIKGFNKFKSLKSDVLEAKDLFVSENLQSISTNDLYDNIIWKTGHQSIDSEKVFKSFKTDVATVNGHINGLMLPDDIVRVDTTEVLSGSTFFMSDLIAASDLEVKGELDGVNLNDLIQKRVTLKAEQVVNSNLNFKPDVFVKGDLLIDGTTNDIVLEMVAKKSNNIPVDGYKVFVSDFRAERSLLVPFINGYNIQSLEQNILKQDGEEFIKELQVFEKPMIAGSHLFVDWINDISLSKITSTFYDLINTLKGRLSFLEDLSYTFWKQLSGQLSAATNKITKFAYFTLLQEINLGPTIKILMGYRLEHLTSNFSHSMVIWTSQKQCTYLEKCCRKEFSHWMRVRKSGHMMVDSESEPGRLYPIPDSTPKSTRKDFFIWTNSSGYQPKWCGDRGDEKMMLASLTDSKYMDVFMDIKNSPTLSDIKSFRRIHLYAVAGYYYDTKNNVYSNAVVYVYSDMKLEWSEHQILPSSGVLSLDIAYYSDKILLAVGSGIGSHSSVYEWDDVLLEFKLLQYISSTYVTSTQWMRQESALLLAMANVDTWPSKEAFCTDLVSGGEINIYIYDSSIKWVQSIPVSGVISLVHFTLEGDDFLVAASTKLQSIFVYEWRGYSGFNLVQSMFVGEVTHLNTFRIEENIYLTVATASGPAKILKVVTQGRHTVTPALNHPVLPPSLSFPEAQKDEAAKDDKPDCGSF